MTKTFTYLSFAATLLTITTAANAEFVPTEIVATDTIEGFTEKQYLGYSADFVGNQLFIGAASTAVGTPTSNSVYIYNISDNGKALIEQIISAPSEADKKFFGYQIAASDEYLGVISSLAKKIYIYTKGEDGMWSADPQAEISVTGLYLGLDANRVVAMENNHVCVESIVKNTDGSYNVVRDAIASDDENKVEDVDEINLAPMAIDIKGNVMTLFVSRKGLYIYEYANESWSESAFVELTNTSNTPQGVAIGDGFISAVSGSNDLYVLEKSGETWANPTCTTISMPYVTKSYRTAASGSFIVVADNNGTTLSSGPHSAEFYTKVDDSWTLVKYVQVGDGVQENGIAMSNAFNGKYYVGTNQKYAQYGNGSGAAFVFNFITDLEYTASEAQSVEENFEEQSPSNVIDIAKEYNATVTYSTSADGEYTEEIPSFEEPGIYTIYYKIEAEGYNTATGSVSFTINEKPSVVTAAVETISNDIRVYAIGRNIVVENAEGKSINIYNITGTSVYAATSINSKEVINSSKSGIYIIEVDGTAYKVVVK